MINDLDYEEIKFPFSKKDYCRINMFCYEINLAYPVYLSDQNFHNSMDLLLMSDGNKSRYVYIKDFSRFMWNKTKNRDKNIFENVVYSVLVVKKF